MNQPEEGLFLPISVTQLFKDLEHGWVLGKCCHGSNLTIKKKKNLLHRASYPGWGTRRGCGPVTRLGLTAQARGSLGPAASSCGTALPPQGPSRRRRHLEHAESPSSAKASWPSCPLGGGWSQTPALASTLSPRWPLPRSCLAGSGTWVDLTAGSQGTPNVLTGWASGSMDTPCTSGNFSSHL